MNKNLSGASAFFYGFAENKETEINLDKAVSIHEIYVTPGQEVNKGELLMEVKQTEIDFKINKIGHDLAQMEIVSLQQKKEILDEIEQLQAQQKKKEDLVGAEIKQLNATLDFNKSLLKDLKSIDLPKQREDSAPVNQQIEFLKNQLHQEVALIDLKINQLRNQLKTIHLPSNIVQEKLKKEIDYHEKEQGELLIYAPSDGLIGNIHCKPGENIDAFSTLINFYERNPTLVKGFVHESLILQVKVGDSLEVASSLHPSHQIDGVVMGLGSRIVEIPERLRKTPDFKTYGREVLIQIPTENPFLQKEKVILNSSNMEGDFSIVSIFFPTHQPTKEQEKKIRKSVSLK